MKDMRYDSAYLDDKSIFWVYVYDDGYGDAHAYKSWARRCYGGFTWCIVPSMHIGI